MRPSIERERKYFRQLQGSLPKMQSRNGQLSIGVSTSGSPARLKDVLSNIGSPVKRPKAV